MEYDADYSPRPTPLERNYSSRLSFVSHNRRSSFFDNDSSASPLFKRSGSAPDALSIGRLDDKQETDSRSSSCSSGINSGLSMRGSSGSSLATSIESIASTSKLPMSPNTSMFGTEEDDRTPTKRPNDGLSHYGLKTVAKRRDSEVSRHRSGLSTSEVSPKSFQFPPTPDCSETPSEPSSPYFFPCSSGDVSSDMRFTRKERSSISSESSRSSRGKPTVLEERDENIVQSEYLGQPMSSLACPEEVVHKLETLDDRRKTPARLEPIRSISQPRLGLNSTATTHTFAPLKSPAATADPVSPTKRGSVAEIIQSKKRQVSAPYHSLPRNFSMSNLPSTTPAWGSVSPESSPAHKNADKPRRIRSRHATRIYGASEGGMQSLKPLHISLNSLNLLQFDHTDTATTRNSPSWEKPEHTDVLMTPTTEEWKSWGGEVGSNRLKIRRRSSDGTPRRSDNMEDVEESESEDSSSSDSEEELRIEEIPLNPRQTFQYSFENAEPTSTAQVALVSQNPSRLAGRPVASIDFDHMATYSSPHNIETPNTGLVLLDQASSLREEAVALVADGPIDPRKYSAKTGARSIHSFKIEGEAGQGAYGNVVKARELSSIGYPQGPKVIIKYIIKQRILADCWKKQKILGPIPVEIHVLDHLRRIPYSDPLPRSPTDTVPRPLTGHPNICSVLDFFEDAEHYYLCMPCFGTGQDLFDYVDNAPDGLPITEVQNIFTQVTSAVAFLHLHGIVHRDIKDENVILDGKGGVQLIDFGSAAYLKEGRKFDTFSGTLDFAAPEVLRGERYDGKETDIWALGILGYVLVCGECPFWNSEEAVHGLSANSRAAAALRAKLHPPGSLKPVNHLLALAIDLIERCLEANAEDRPSAMQACRHQFIMEQFQGKVASCPLAWKGRRGWLQ